VGLITLLVTLQAAEAKLDGLELEEHARQLALAAIGLGMPEVGFFELCGRMPRGAADDVASS
jgi:hypothetical protein